MMLTFAPLLIGISGAALVMAAAHGVGFARDRSFVPTVLVVIALLYVLFGAMEGTVGVVVTEGAVALVFVVLAAVSFRWGSAGLLAAGLALHGGFDLVHPVLLPQSGTVPAWWPGLCLGFDVALAGWVWFRWCEDCRDRFPPE